MCPIQGVKNSVTAQGTTTEGGRTQAVTTQDGTTQVATSHCEETQGFTT